MAISVNGIKDKIGETQTLPSVEELKNICPFWENGLPKNKEKKRP